uniref:ATP synthase epsilon chain, chloroplastic n=1 Tax=Dictyopteris divaricata TaxID=156996 RepID=A0A2I4Q2F3_9PHAE|nr:ATP synthase CF1 epsilon chain [Dictyopteris divaricata]YP_010205305.1 ATP synthase CF1 epsilon chain [Grateloupia livida]AQZ25017.1 ATP synthase CF1 epsilon chain [Dictyopteris divaricata]UAV85874.1 ATP synthase CF1 epsilon chain [Grateloupia livida]
MAINIRIVTPTGFLWETKAEEIFLPSTTGPLTVLPGHINILTGLAPGLLRVKVDSRWKPILISSGAAQVMTLDLTTVQVGIMEVEEIKQENFKEAELLLEKANETLSGISPTDIRERIKALEAKNFAESRVEAFKFLTT